MHRGDDRSGGPSGGGDRSGGRFQRGPSRWSGGGGGGAGSPPHRYSSRSGGDGSGRGGSGGGGRFHPYRGSSDFSGGGGVGGGGGYRGGGGDDSASRGNATVAATVVEAVGISKIMIAEVITSNFLLGLFQGQQLKKMSVLYLRSMEMFLKLL